MTLIQFFGDVKSSFNHKNQPKSAETGQAAEAASASRAENETSRQQQPVELGRIAYVNIESSSGFKHGDVTKAIDVAKTSDKPIFANFIEYPGCAGVYQAGKTIFSHPDIVDAVQEAFVPAYFNTWDRNDAKYNQAMVAWGGKLKNSDWGYIRIVDSTGKQVIAETQAITGSSSVKEVATFMVLALEAMERPIPRSLSRYCC